MTAGGPSPGSRGQLVLLAAAVVAVALVPMAVAYSQVADGGVTARPSSPETTASERVRRALAPAVHDAALGVAGRSWASRSDVAAAVNATLDPRVGGLERAELTGGRSLAVRQDHALATAWATRRCPSGPNRAFGPCVAVGGLVLQERAGEATLVAVAFAVRVTDPDATRRLPLVVRVDPPAR